MKTERELFEEWAYSKKWNIFRVRDMGIDRYVDDFVDGAWSGWQASASREGYKFVPVEPSEDMIMVGCMEHGGYDVIDSKSIYKAMIEAVEK